MSRTIAVMVGVIECGMMMATPANRRIMADAGVLGPAGEAAGPGDLVIAIAAQGVAEAQAALAAARTAIDAPKAASAGSAVWAPRTIRAAVQSDPAANLALISVPGAFAAAEARKALSRGLNVMMFSDNVALADEVALKHLARERGLLLMGPDCGTAIINGAPLGFANNVPRGDIGIIGASGTGIQEVSCLIARRSTRGISHAIGTGGRDLKAEVGGMTTLTAIDLLDADTTTRHIVLISKPPAKAVARTVLERVGKSHKTFTVCFLGMTSGLTLPSNARLVPTLYEAAGHAAGEVFDKPALRAPMAPGKRFIRGLFAGGTLCAEAQYVLMAAGLPVASNAPIPGARFATTAHEAHGAHLLLDLGDDAFTQGRPHPMIEPSVRDQPLIAALNDPTVGIVLLDVVIGTGGHADPAGHLVRCLNAARTARKVPPLVKCPTILGSVTGTEGDWQGFADQCSKVASLGLRHECTALAAAAAVNMLGTLS